MKNYELFENAALMAFSATIQSNAHATQMEVASLVTDVAERVKEKNEIAKDVAETALILAQVFVDTYDDWLILDEQQQLKSDLN